MMQGYAGMTPGAVETYRQRAKRLAANGANGQPMGHWTQALAGVLSTGLGGHYEGEADQGEASGQADANKALTDALSGGKPIAQTASSLLANPWSADTGQKLALHELTREPADPLDRQIKMEKLKQLRQPAAADMRVVGGKVVRVKPDGTVETAFDSEAGSLGGGGGVEALFGGGDNLSQSLLSGNFDKDLEAILQGVSPNNRAKVWVTAQQIKQRALKAGALAQQPAAPIAGAPSQPMPAATPSIDQQRLEMVAQRFADAPAAQKNDAFRIQSAANSIEKNLARYEDLVGRTGYVMPGEVADSDAVGAEIRNLQLQLKELYNLGVLNGPDLSLMEQVLVDPRVSGLAGTANAGIDSVFGGGGSARVKASVSRMRAMLNDVLKGRGLEPIEEKSTAVKPNAPAANGGGYSGMSDEELSSQWQ